MPGFRSPSSSPWSPIIASHHPPDPMATGAIAKVSAILREFRRSLDRRGYRGGPEMPHFLYVSLQDDNKILVFAIDAETGGLTPQAEVAVAGGPAVLAIGNERRVLYVGHRGEPRISSFRIDRRSGGLGRRGSRRTIAPADLSRPRPQRQVFAVGLLSRRVCRGAPARRRRRRRCPARSSGWRPPSAPTRSRPIPRTASPSSAYRPAQRQRSGAAARGPSPNMILQFRFDASAAV